MNSASAQSSAFAGRLPLPRYDKLILQEAAGELLSPARRRGNVDTIILALKVSERWACRALGQHRSTERKVPRGRDDEEPPTADLIELAREYARYGCRKIDALLRHAGWLLNDKRVERIWRREGLKVPAKQPKRTSLAGGRFLHPCAASPSQPRLVL